MCLVSAYVYRHHGKRHIIFTPSAQEPSVSTQGSKNRKKIFEWDILFQGQELLGVVCISKRYGVSILKTTTTWSLINFVLDSDFDAGVLSDIEVRGNIYDNPELME